MKNIVLLLTIIVGLTKIGFSQALECDRYYISDVRDSTINVSSVVVFSMFTDKNTTSLGSYTSLCFINQNGDTLNPRPNFSNYTPVANTPDATRQYVLYFDSGFTNFPPDFDGILLMEVPYCEIPYNHRNPATPVKGINDHDIQIFPNPASEKVLITNRSNIEITSVELYNAAGMLLQIRFYDVDEIAISDLASGVYYVKVYADSKLVTTRKIVRN